MFNESPAIPTLRPSLPSSKTTPLIDRASGSEQKRPMPDRILTLFCPISSHPGPLSTAQKCNYALLSRSLPTTYCPCPSGSLKLEIHSAYACLVATLHAASGFLVDCVIYFQVRLLEYTRQHPLDVFHALQQRQILKIKFLIIVYMFLRKKKWMADWTVPPRLRS